MQIGGLHISLPNMVYLCLSSVICVFVHELGHALAAASEGVHVEYVAIFLAVLFPGALVAFNHSSLQALPLVASLRIYCAGIWHNAAFCVGCALALVLLPFIFSPFYIHGESLMVLDVPSMSPLYGYLSRHDVIFSLDSIRIHTTEEWKQTITMLTEQTYSLSSDQPSVNLNVENGYCIPQSLTKEIAQVQFKGNQTYCPKELIAFASMTCLDVEKHTNDANRNNHQRRENIHCLDAKDVIKLKKCAYPNFKEQALTNGSSCLCSEVESCLTPMQLPGLQWVEITYSTLECHSRRRSLFSPEKHSSSEKISCLQTFVYVGDLITMANSIHLTSYKPRWSIYFMAYLANLLEKLFTYASHVSMGLALLNSLPGIHFRSDSTLFRFIELQDEAISSAVLPACRDLFFCLFYLADNLRLCKLMSVCPYLVGSFHHRSSFNLYVRMCFEFCSCLPVDMVVFPDVKLKLIGVNLPV
ncbi:hypothetical protein ABFS83_07G107700 [Erythranthe nasuta]